MKIQRLALAVVLIAVIPVSANAQRHNFGLGVIVGEPTGLSAKGWISSRGAIDAGLAWSFRREGFIHAHIDYLWHFHDAVDSERLVIPYVIPYVGVGGRVGGTKGAAVVGIRMPVGISWIPGSGPLDVFLEVVPVVDMTPATEFTAQGGLGIRFYF